MNKSTIVKLLFLVVACLVIIPMVIACGGNTTDGSTPTTESTPSSVPSTENSVPSTENSQPSTENSQPSTENSQPSTEESTPSNPATIIIMYDPGQGDFENVNDFEHEVPYNDRYTKHPTPKRDGYMFEYWCTDEACTIPVKSITKYTADTVLYAKWKTSFKCTDGSYDHNFTQYVDGNPATCTTPATKVQYCTYCQGENITESGEPLGHQWGAFEEAFMRKERACGRAGCGEKEIVEYSNVTLELLGKNYAQNITVDGPVFTNPATLLFNGTWDEDWKSSFAASSSTTVSVTARLETYSTFDRIYFSGIGGSQVSIFVQYEGESDFSFLGITSFLSEGNAGGLPVEDIVFPFVTVDNTKNVVAVKVVEENPKRGEAVWKEIAFVKVVDEAE